MIFARVPAFLALTVLSPIALPLACAHSPPAVTPSSESSASEAASDAPAAGSAAASSEPVAPATPASTASPCAQHEMLDAKGNCVAAGCPAGQILGPDGACKAKPPCLDGEEMMGACICPHGKTVDDTGHCAASPCPPGASGGAVFRNEAGDCMECRAGTVPCGTSCCPGGPRRGH